MDRLQAERLLHESFARPTATPCTWRGDRETYLAEEQARLRQCLIEPVLVQAVPISWPVHLTGDAAEIKPFWAIARSGEQWLLVDLAEHSFALAFGQSSDDILSMLGFSSADALAEWLG